MIKTAIIGNSHILAVKQALAKRFGQQFGEQSFCMIHEWRIDGASEANGRCGTLRGIQNQCLELDQFEQFLICGAGWWAARNHHLAGNPPSHPLVYMSRVEWGKGLRKPATSRLVSEAFFNKVVEEWVLATNVARFARHLANNTSRRIIIQPWPAPNRDLKYDKSWLVNSWFGETGPLAWADFFRAQKLASVRLSEVGEQTVLLDYPREDIERDGFMDASLCDKRDPFHGSTEYGELVVDQLERFL